MEYNGKHLEALSTLNAKDYAKVHTRMTRKMMTKYILNDTLYYDVDEYENYQGKKRGVKPKIHPTINNFEVIDNIWIDSYGIIKVKDKESGKIYYAVGKTHDNITDEFADIELIINEDNFINEKELKKFIN